MSQKRFFPNLNGIRFIAAFMVMLHHLEQAKHAMNVPDIYTVDIVQHAGRLGVGLFFVLSGFLITYLLLQEKHAYGDIDAPKFYLRRVFRIWPIYFVVVLSSIFILPHLELFAYPGANENVTNHFSERLTFLLLVLPNFAFVLYDLPYWCAQAWSIGVEEQFYYLWPWLIKYPKRKWILIIGIFLLVSVGVLWFGLYQLQDSHEVQLKKIGTFIGQFRIQIMALGGLIAWMVFTDKQRILNFLYRKDLQVVVYTTLLALFLSGIHFKGFMEVYGLFFAYLILNVSCNPNTIINLENRWVSYLGKISYGLYLYHVIVIVAVINTLNKLYPEMDVVLFNIIAYSSTVVLSVAIAALSFEYFEKPLLRFKDKKFGR